jgi:hypothetical protein
MKKLFLIALLFTALLPQMAYAGFCENWQTKDELKNAHYIGMLKLLKTEPAPPIPTKPGAMPIPIGDIITVEPIQSFTDEEKTEPFKVWWNGAEDGWHAGSEIFIDVVFEAKDKVYFESVFEGKEKLYFAKICDVEKQLEKFGFAMPEKHSETFQREEKKCEEAGKKLVIEGKKVNCEESK